MGKRPCKEILVMKRVQFADEGNGGGRDIFNLPN
jgi:hypothetical protein